MSDADDRLRYALRTGEHLRGAEEKRALTWARVIRFLVWVPPLWTAWMVWQGALAVGRHDWFAVVFLVWIGLGLYATVAGVRLFVQAGRYLDTRAR